MELERTFDEAARARVAEAVRVAEAGSRGQVVPVVVARSDAYPEARLRGALLGAAAVTAALLLSPLPVTPGELPLAQLAGALLGWGLTWLAPVERFLVGHQHLDREVRARAMRAFLEHGLHQTSEGTGVLVFASLLEREAVVLGDHGIHARVGDGEWQATVDALVAGMKRGAAADGFVEAIGRCGARLAEHFPRDGASATTPNELPDAIQLDRS
jgi:putative membrane protein